MHKEKLIFAAAVLCTALSAILIFAVVFLQDISLLNAASAASVCCFLMWMVYHSLTHDCMGRKITPRAEPVRNISRTVRPPEGRFVFSEETVREKMGRIAELFKLEMKCRVNHYYMTGATDFSIDLSGKSNFTVFIDYNCIGIWAGSLTVCKPLDPLEPLDGEKYYKYYHFCFPCGLIKGKADVSAEYEYDYEDTFFASDILFDDLSDDEIFGIIEKMIYALYGTKSMTFRTETAWDGNQSFTFYLDAPDYYGYTETTEIGNFKFILNQENGGKENV